MGFRNLQEKLEKGFLFYCVSRTARHTQNVRKNEREDKKVEVVVADKKKFRLALRSSMAWRENLGPGKVMYRSSWLTSNKASCHLAKHSFGQRA